MNPNLENVQDSDEEGACFWPTSNKADNDDWTTVNTQDTETIGTLVQAARPKRAATPAPEWNECNSDLR